MMQQVPEYLFEVTGVINDTDEVTVRVEATMDVRAVSQGRAAIRVDYNVPDLQVRITGVRQIGFEPVNRIYRDL